MSFVPDARQEVVEPGLGPLQIRRGAPARASGGILHHEIKLMHVAGVSTKSHMVGSRSVLRK